MIKDIDLLLLAPRLNDKELAQLLAELPEGFERADDSRAIHHLEGLIKKHELLLPGAGGHVRLGQGQPQTEHQSLVGAAAELNSGNKIAAIIGEDLDVELGVQLDIPIPALGQPWKNAFELAAQGWTDLLTGRRAAELQKLTRGAPVIYIPPDL